MYLTVDIAGNITVHEEGGSSVPFYAVGSGYQAPSRVMATLVANADGTLTFTRIHGQDKYVFAAPTQTSNGQLLKEVDPNGYTTTLSYTGGRLTSVTDPANRSISFAYTDTRPANVNHITSVTDPANRSVQFTYDANGNLTDVIDVRGGHSYFTYDGNHQLVTMEDARQYALSGAISTGSVVTNVYDTQGRVTQQSDQMGRLTKLAYSANPDGTQTTTITDPNNNVTTQLYSDDRVMQETVGVGSPQQATTQYSYDTRTNSVSQLVDGNNHAWTFTYDGFGNLLSVKDPLANLTTYTYDNLNDLKTVTDPVGNVQGGTPANYTTTYTYDASGNLQTVSDPFPEQSKTVMTTIGYTDTTHPGDVTQVTDPNNHTTTYTYDPTTGNLMSMTDAVGNLTTYTYDSIGRLQTVVEPAGNITGNTPSSYTDTIVLDNAFELTDYTDVLSHHSHYVYDANGNLTQATDPKSHTTTYTYDADNEVTQTTYADHTYTTAGYDNNGNVTSQQDGTQVGTSDVTSYTYDPLNRIATMSTPAPNGTDSPRTTQYSYDLASNLKTITDPVNRVTTYGYDNANELQSIQYSDGVRNGRDDTPIPKMWGFDKQLEWRCA